MKVKSFPLVAAAALLACARFSYAAVNINGAIGSRQLDEELWDPVDHQPAFGVLADFSVGNLPLYASVGLQVSAATEDDFYYDYTGSVAELSAGLKVMPRAGVFRPYFGAGVASVGAAFEAESNSWSYRDLDDSDQSFGYYANAGALVRVARHLNIGLDLRWIGGTDITLFGIEGDADSFVGSVVIGYGWD